MAQLLYSPLVLAILLILVSLLHTHAFCSPWTTATGTGKVRKTYPSLQQIRRQIGNSVPNASSSNLLPNRPISSAPSSVLFNISWTTASSADGLAYNLHRADVDTALTIFGFGNVLGIGVSCKDTFLYSDVQFSGDNAYSPGWEAYLVPLSIWTSAPLLSDSTISVYAYRRVIPFIGNTTLSVKLYDENGSIVQAETNPIDNVGGVYPGCPTIYSYSPVATLSFSLGNASANPSFDLVTIPISTVTPAPPEDTPEPEEEEEPDFSAEPEPSPGLGNLPFPPVLSTQSLLVVFSWVSSGTDIESGIGLSGLPGIFSTCDESTLNIYTSGNSFSFVGSESFLVDIGRLRANKFPTVTNQWTFDLFADWWSDYNAADTASVTVSVRAPGGALLGNESKIDIFPGVVSSCTPDRKVGTAFVKYNEVTQAFQVTDLEAEPEPTSTYFTPPWDTDPTALPTTSPGVEEDEVDTTPMPTDEPPFDEQFLGEMRLSVTFSWSASETDLDTQVIFLGGAKGVRCYDSPFNFNSYIAFSGDSTESTGTERYFLLLERAKLSGMWVEYVDATLFAYWYARSFYAGGKATVSVDLLDKNDTIVDTQSMDFNPYVGMPLLTKCGENKVGRIRVTAEKNGSISMKLGIF